PSERTKPSVARLATSGREDARGRRPACRDIEEDRGRVARGQDARGMGADPSTERRQPTDLQDARLQLGRGSSGRSPVAAAVWAAVVLMMDREPEVWETSAAGPFATIASPAGDVTVWALGGDRFRIQ